MRLGAHDGRATRRTRERRSGEEAAGVQRREKEELTGGHQLCGQTEMQWLRMKKTRTCAGLDVRLMTALQVLQVRSLSQPSPTPHRGFLALRPALKAEPARGIFIGKRL